MVDELDPDIVLCDIRMQGASGLDLCRRCTERDPSRTVVLLSASMTTSSTCTRRCAPALSGYLLKRVSGDELVRSLEQVHAGQTVVDGTLAARVASSAARLDSA